MNIFTVITILFTGYLLFGGVFSVINDNVIYYRKTVNVSGRPYCFSCISVKRNGVCDEVDGILSELSQRIAESVDAVLEEYSRGDGGYSPADSVIVPYKYCAYIYATRISDDIISVKIDSSLSSRLPRGESVIKQIGFLFDTRLDLPVSPMVLKVLPSFRKSVKRGLPEYIFEHDGDMYLVFENERLCMPSETFLYEYVKLFHNDSK